MFKFAFAGFYFEWNGSHTVNVFLRDKNIDCFSLDYSRDDLTEGDAMIAARDWVMAADIVRQEGRKNPWEMESANA